MNLHFYYLNINSGLAYCNGIGILSSVLKREGYNVSATHLTSSDNLEGIVKEDLKNNPSEIVGISVVTNQAKYVPIITRTIRENSDSISIAGGIHATIAPQDLKNKGIDYVFQGESENSLLEFVKNLERGKNLEKIRGIWPNPPAQLTDLSKIPQEDKEILNFGEIINKKNMWAGEVIATRGCPYECSYCCNSTINEFYRKGLRIQTKDILRRRPIEHVIEELSAMQEKYPGIKMFILGDDTFTLKKNYCLDFLNEYKKNIEKPFVCNVNLLSFDKDIANSLKEAKCYEIKVGIESGSERIRKEVLNRAITNEKILEKTEMAHNSGLNISTFNMLGLPTETPEELMETLELNSKIKPRRMKFMIFYPYPLTPAADLCQRLNLINENKLRELDNYNTDTPLNFNDKYMKVFYKVWANLDHAINSLYNGEYYEMMQNIPGMVLRKER